MAQIICILIPLVGVTVLMPYILRKCSGEHKGWLVWSMFVIYILGNMYFTLLSRVPDSGQYLELQPFRTYGRLFESATEDSTATGFAAMFLDNTLPIVSLILNIFLYYPLGYFLPILFPKLKPKHVILIGCLCSIATEATQYLLKMGWCETDDVIHNTLGTTIGVWLWIWQSKRLNKPKSNELPKD